MIYGLFLDPRIWKTDYLTNRFWDPLKFGIQIDSHKDPFQIPKTGINKKYKLFIFLFAKCFLTLCLDKF